MVLSPDGCLKFVKKPEGIGTKMKTFHAIMGNPMLFAFVAWVTIVCILSVACISLQQILELLRKLVPEEEDDINNDMP